MQFGQQLFRRLDEPLARSDRYPRRNYFIVSLGRCGLVWEVCDGTVTQFGNNRGLERGCAFYRHSELGKDLPGQADPSYVIPHRYNLHLGIEWLAVPFGGIQYLECIDSIKELDGL